MCTSAGCDPSARARGEVRDNRRECPARAAVFQPGRQGQGERATTGPSLLPRLQVAIGCVGGLLTAVAL